MQEKDKIIVIGESAIDSYVDVQINRISPEAPIPVLVPKSRYNRPGMAGNVVENLVSLRVLPEGDIVFVRPKNNIIKTRYVDKTSGYIMARVDENDEIINQEKDFFLEEDFAKLITSYDPTKIKACVISDYAKGFLTEKNIEFLSKVFSDLGVPTFLDTKKILGEWSKLITFVKINQKEYNSQLLHGVRSPQDFCQNLLVTQGAKGIWHVNSDLHVPVKNVQVSDLTGCGDVALAGLVTGWLETLDLYKSLEFSNNAASFAATQRGVVAVKREDLSKID